MEWRDSCVPLVVVQLGRGRRCCPSMMARLLIGRFTDCSCPAVWWGEEMQDGQTIKDRSAELLVGVCAA